MGLEFVRPIPCLLREVVLVVSSGLCAMRCSTNGVAFLGSVDKKGNGISNVKVRRHRPG